MVFVYDVLQFNAFCSWFCCHPKWCILWDTNVCSVMCCVFQRNLTETQKDAITKDFNSLNLTMYVGEMVSFATYFVFHFLFLGLVIPRGTEATDNTTLHHAILTGFQLTWKTPVRLQEFYVRPGIFGIISQFMLVLTL